MRSRRIIASHSFIFSEPASKALKTTIPGSLAHWPNTRLIFPHLDVGDSGFSATRGSHTRAILSPGFHPARWRQRKPAPRFAYSLYSHDLKKSIGSPVEPPVECEKY